MEYARDALAGRGVIGGAGAPVMQYAQQAVSSAPPPRLPQQLEQMEKVLHACFAATDRLEKAAMRLNGPRPTDTPKESGRPPAETIEQRLAVLIGMAETLAGRLNATASQFDAAV